MHGDRDVVSDRAVGSVLVVVPTPILQLFAGVGKAHEPVCVQTLRPEFAVERLDEPVVRGFPGPREVEGDVVGIGPEIEVPGDELAAIIDPDRLWITDLPANPFERLNDVFSAVAEAGIGRRAEPRMRIDDSQDAQLLAQGELVVHEVHCPDIVRPGGFLAVFPELGLHPPLRMLVSQLQAQLVVNPAGFLHVDHPALSPQQHVNTPVSIPHTRFSDLFDAPFDGSLVRSPGLVVVGGGVKANGPTGFSDRHSPINAHPGDNRAQTARLQSFRRMTS